MHSADLLDVGFGAWLCFGTDSESALLVHLPLTPGAFAIRRRPPYQLPVGESDIAYIGYGTSKGGIRERVRQCFHPGPTQTTNLRIREAIRETGGFELSWRQRDSASEARRLVKDLLRRYQHEHEQLPPLRVRG